MIFIVDEVTKLRMENWDYTFLGNCPPTPPLSQHFALIEK